MNIAAAREALKQGELESAAAIAGEILRSDPKSIDALEIKALVEIERGDHAAAERSLRSAIAAAPKRRWHYADLIRLLIKLGRNGDAESVACEALVADPANADAHAMLASLLAEREMLVLAAAHFERAIELAGRHPDLLLGLGRTLQRQGKLEIARPFLEAAASAKPGELEPWAYLAELEERAGNFDAALRLLDKGEPIAAASGTDLKLQRSLLLDRMGRTEEALDLLEGQMEISGAALLQRGRLRDQLGRYDEAWSDWVTGKSLLAERAGRHYAAAKVEAQAEALANFFTAEQFAALPRAPPRADVPQPIFILGFPRSGTTLTEQILASHSAVRAGGELPFGRELREFAAALAGGEDHFPAGLARMATADGEGWPAQLRDLYLRRAEAFGLTAPGADYFTDKMPLNDMWLPLLRIAFPQSPVVLVRRHPLDVLTSVMSHDMTHGFHCAYRLEDAARHLSLVDRLLAAYRDAGMGVSYELRYESLVVDQAGETERLMAAIGLPLERDQLSFHERDAVSPTPSYAQVRKAISPGSIGRWRNYAVQMDQLQAIVAEAMTRGGY
jgi:Tfp pilus assembly protein PilF